MKAVMLASGLGTRNSEETSIKPTPIGEIGGWPILWHILKIFRMRMISMEVPIKSPSPGRSPWWRYGGNQYDRRPAEAGA